MVIKKPKRFYLPKQSEQHCVLDVYWQMNDISIVEMLYNRQYEHLYDEWLNLINAIEISNRADGINDPQSINNMEDL